MEVAPAEAQRPRSAGRVAALVVGIGCIVLVGIATAWPLTLKIVTPGGTVTWDCGTRFSARHYSLAQAATMLHDTRPLTVGTYTYSASHVAQIDRAAVDGNCGRDLGVEWTEGAAFLLATGVMLLVVGLVRVRWRWLFVPLLLGAALFFFGVPLLFADVFRLYSSWGLPGYTSRPGFG